MEAPFRFGEQTTWCDNLVYSKVWGYLTAFIVFGFLIFFLVFGGYDFLDSVGWISHREQTLITANADWLVGESKECWSITLDSHGASLLDKDTGYAMYSVDCGDGPQHSIKVKFYGREIQGQHTLVRWRCEREQPSFFNDDAFTCYETGNQEAPTSNP